MDFFSRHVILKSLAVVTSSILILVVASFVGSYLGVVPHVAMTYMTGGIMASWAISSAYDRIVLKKVDKQIYRTVQLQQEDIKSLKRSVKELERFNGTEKAPFTAKYKK